MKKKFVLPDKFVVKVTTKDIMEGKPGYSSFCPIALALKRQFPKQRICVAARINIGNYRRDLPPKADDFILDFDHGNRVYPFQFTVKKNA